MSYIISEPAQLDIEDIYEYSIIEFGVDRTIYYLMQMEEVFNSLENHHHLGTSRNHISQNLYAIAYKSHMIFYSITSENEILITRILHGSRDIPNHIKT
jgi:toxin ParE1/3/4